MTGGVPTDEHARRVREAVGRAPRRGVTRGELAILLIDLDDDVVFEALAHETAAGRVVADESRLTRFRLARPGESRERKWILRPPRTFEDVGDTKRPMVSVGPPVEEWTEVVPESALVAAQDQAEAVVAALREVGVVQLDDGQWEAPVTDDGLGVETLTEALRLTLDSCVLEGRARERAATHGGSVEDHAHAIHELEPPDGEAE